MPQSCAACARRLALPLLLLVVGVLTGCGALAPARQDPQAEAQLASDHIAFTVEVRAPKAVREYLEKHLELQRFRELPDLQARELSRLLGAADANARDLLATLGYFSPELNIAIDDTPRESGVPLTVVVAVDPGPQTNVHSVDLHFQGAIEESDAAGQAAAVRSDWPLAPGRAFTQEGWDGAKNGGLRTLQRQRFPTASIARSRAEVDADTHRAALSVTYDSGPVYRFGELALQGMERYDAEGMQNIARLPTGAEYSESALLDAQQRLASSGYFDAVFLTLDTDANLPQAAPVLAQVREAPLQKAVFGIGFSTDSGARVSVDHTHNQLPVIGWRALSKVSVDQKATRLGTDWMALPGANGWRWFTGAQVQRETTGSYEVNGARVRLGRSKSSDHIDRNYALQYDSAVSQGPMAPPESSALSLNYSWTGRYFDSDTAPANGWGVAAEMGGGFTLRPERDPFVRVLARWLSFTPFGTVEAPNGGKAHARIALRAEAGAVVAREGAQIPVTQLFLTGGDTTVRGYSLRSIAARTENDQRFGGRYLGVASAEWQRPLVLGGELSDFETAVFIDAGAVADRMADMDLRVGVGAGLRWKSPVGPLQADLAYGVQAKQLRLHLRLGFSF